MIFPKSWNFRLEHGSKIALVAPAARFDHDIIPTIVEIIKQWGYEPVYSGSIFEKSRELAGADWIRARDFIRWFSDPDVSVIWPIRGGYGSSRIINFLNPERMASGKKILLGYSDVTFLHLTLVNKGFLGSVHGPNAIELVEESKGATETIRRFFQGELEFRWSYDEKQVVKHGVASGHLVGGNLTCLCHLLGTRFLSPDLWNGAILFLEDHNEAAYRIDRMFNHLKLAGVFDNISGLILGNFNGCESSERFRARISDILSSFEFPVVYNMPFGHNIKQDVLPLRYRYNLDTFQGSFCLEPST